MQPVLRNIFVCLRVYQFCLCSFPDSRERGAGGPKGDLQRAAGRRVAAAIAPARQATTLVVTATAERYPFRFQP